MPFGFERRAMVGPNASSSASVPARLVWSAVLVLAVALQLLMLGRVFESTLWPPDAALLVGENAVGPLARSRDGLVPVRSLSGGESQFTWAVALDPWMRDADILRVLGDQAPYRYQRLLLPFGAWLLPGDMSLLAYRLLAMSVVGLAIAVWAAARLAVWFQLPRAVPILLVVLNPGVIFSLLHPMPDLWGLSLSLCGMAFWFEGRRWFGVTAFALAVLSKETAIAVPLCLGVYGFVRNRSRAAESWVLALALVPAALWQLVIKSRLGTWPFQATLSRLDLPYVALIRGGFDVLLTGQGAIDFFAALALSALTVLVLFRLRASFGPLQAVLAGQALLLSMTGGSTLVRLESSATVSALFLIWVMLVALRHLGVAGAGGPEHAAPKPSPQTPLPLARPSIDFRAQPGPRRVDVRRSGIWRD